VNAGLDRSRWQPAAHGLGEVLLVHDPQMHRPRSGIWRGPGPRAWPGPRVGPVRGIPRTSADSVVATNADMAPARLGRRGSLPVVAAGSGPPRSRAPSTTATTRGGCRTLRPARDRLPSDRRGQDLGPGAPRSLQTRAGTQWCACLKWDTAVRGRTLGIAVIGEGGEPADAEAVGGLHVSIHRARLASASGGNPSGSSSGGRWTCRGYLDACT
jgi:hypothetical protein